MKNLEYKSLLLAENNKVRLSEMKSYLTQYYKSSIYDYLKPQMGGFIDKGSLSFTIISTQQNDDKLHIKAGVFFEEQIGGCNCGDEPHTENGYSEIQIALTECDIQFI